MAERDTVAEIKERLDIVDIIGSYLTVHKAGKHVKANCPFHNEKTPSFFISPERQTFYCFGCGEKGDMFSFVQKYEGLEFVEALKLLADRAGVEIAQINPEARTEKNRHVALLEQAAEYFVEQLTGSADAREYLEKRELAGEPEKIFRIGYAKDGWRNLYDHFTALKVSEEDLLAVGLIKKTDDGKVYDVFRHRIMFPVMDASGRVIGFSGRSLPGADDKTPKYLNTPETKLFDKSGTLYAYDKAKTAMRRLDAAILVEGQIDVIACHKHGYRNAIAPLGTALTPRHITLIKRMTNNVLFALDADKAGIASMERGAHLALAAGCDVKVARLPDGTDPADILDDDPSKWKEIIKESTHVVEFLLKLLRDEHEDDRTYHKHVRNQVLPYIARIENKIDQAYFIKKVSQALGVSEDVVTAEVGKAPVESVEVDSGGSVEGDSNPQNPQASRKEKIAATIGAAILLMKDDPRSSEWGQRFQELTGDSLDPSESSDQHIFELESTLEDLSALDGSVDEMFLLLELELLKEQHDSAMQELTRAESGEDTAAATKALQEIQKLNEHVEELKQKLVELTTVE